MLKKLKYIACRALYEIIIFFKFFPRSAKHFLQKCTRGFSDKDTWNIDVTVAKFVLPRLKRFKELTNGHPHEITWEEWIEILDKIIYSFEMASDDDKYYGLNITENEKVQEGFALFGAYYTSLWW